MWNIENVDEDPCKLTTSETNEDGSIHIIPDTIQMSSIWKLVPVLNGSNFEYFSVCFCV